MWRDVSDRVALRSGKIIHDSQTVGKLSWGYISVCAPRYRVRLERGVDAEGYFNKFFIEKDFEAHELREQAFVTSDSNGLSNDRPLVVVRRMKFIDVTHDGNELYLNVESIVLIKRLQVNRCQVTLTTGVTLEIEYDAKRIRTKLEELDPAAFAGA